MYECKICKYKTNDHSNLLRHNKTKKHINALTIEYECVECKNIYYTQKGYIKHKCRYAKIRFIIKNSKKFETMENINLNKFTNKLIDIVDYKLIGELINNASDDLVSKLIDNVEDDLVDEFIGNTSAKTKNTNVNNINDDRNDRIIEYIKKDHINKFLSTTRHESSNINMTPMYDAIENAIDKYVFDFDDSDDYENMDKDELIQKIKTMKKTRKDDMNSVILLKTIESNMKNMEMLLKEKDKCQNMTNELLQFTKEMAMGAGNLAGSTVNALTYAMKNYKNAPELKQLEDKTAKELLTENLKDRYAQYYMNAYINGTLVKYIGDIIKEKYSLPNNPEQQSLWNTDFSRSTYIVKISQTQNKTVDWERDIDGEEVCNNIIRPLLKELKLLMADYETDMRLKIKKNKITEIELSQYGDYMEPLTIIKEQIKNGKLEKNILEYLCKFFHFRKKSK